jgi:hypothetical protein
MFPPAPTPDTAAWVEQLLLSLERAGLSFDWNLELEEGDHEATVRLRLVVPVAREGWAGLKKYIVDYALMGNRIVTDLRSSAKVLTFTVTR